LKKEATLMNRVDALLDFLAATGSAHTLDEISRSTDIPYHICEEAVHFLARYGFVHLNGFKVEIKPRIRAFIVKTSKKTLLQLPSRVLVTAST